ncbi:MAG: methyltransferase [Aestuariibacter sp.]
MMSSQSQQSYLQEIKYYYQDKFSQFGATHEGVDWNSEESQVLRFLKLFSDIKIPCNSTLNDIGCGYGAMVDFIRNSPNLAELKYVGYDLCQNMIDEAKTRYKENNTTFAHITELNQLKLADYSVASGIFNLKFDHSNEEWINFIKSSLIQISNATRKTFAFNILTAYSDADKQRSDLYYACPLELFDFCKRQISPFVTLKHDYPLYEFTITVSK